MMLANLTKKNGLAWFKKYLFVEFIQKIYYLSLKAPKGACADHVGFVSKLLRCFNLIQFIYLFWILVL